MKQIYFPALAIAAISLTFTPMKSFAQTDSSSENKIYIAPLFDYPVAPDSINSLEAKSTYVVQNFWKGMDFKTKQAVDQTALNHAFEVFVSPMRWSDTKVNEAAVAEILPLLQKNPILSLQFTKAAEQALYSDRAITWDDKLYLQFIDNLLKTKKVPEGRLERYKHHKTVLENSLIGSTPRRFDYVDVNGKKSHFQPDGIITVIEFGDPGCDICRYAKLKMETDVTFSRLVEKGLVSVLFIIPDGEEGWQNELTDISPRWHVGTSENITDIYDIRTSPSFYVIDGEGKIMAKNIPYDVAMQLAVAESEKKK